MVIRRAIRSDLPVIQDLASKYGKMEVGTEHLSHHDIALVARGADGSLMGFIWLGIMAKGTTGYIDKFMVAPEYRKRGVGQALTQALFTEALKRRVVHAFGVIRQDEYHDAYATHALGTAMKGDPFTYTLIRNNLSDAVTDLASLGA